MEALQKLGIDWKLLIAQIINFVILLWLLKRFAYKPIVDLLEKRKKEIAESTENADRIKKELEQTQTKSQQIIKNAEIEAAEIVKKAREGADKTKEEIIAQAKIRANREIESAAEKIKSEKEKMSWELRKETTYLAIKLAKKILEEKASAEIDERALQDILEKADKEK